MGKGSELQIDLHLPGDQEGKMRVWPKQGQDGDV